jgi:predicted small metal-binding protein
MRVLDCECGHTIQAANDDELRAELAEHLRSLHAASDQRPDETELERLVALRAYDATDS